MSYKIARKVQPSACLCSFSSSGAGNVNFTFIGGDFTPSISGSTITLTAGYEYFIASYPSASASVATAYYTILNGVNGVNVGITSTSLTSGRDTTFDSVIAESSDATFQLYSSTALSSNSRLEIWKHPL